ncbi:MULTISPECIES: hypothetical protein [Streptomyces]|uniref:Sporulation protein YjcZ n=1 Tax=Streptomyces lienomycini TaxID=284035 RepID=A0ABV9WYR4_9ACTN|nr:MULTISPECIES: hypothetical protein [Streptomyces]
MAGRGQVPGGGDGSFGRGAGQGCGFCMGVLLALVILAAVVLFGGIAALSGR